MRGVKYLSACYIFSLWAPCDFTLITANVTRPELYRLASCSVHIITEGLRGKSRWLRKSPLEIKHPTRDIFEGQREVLLFAAGSAAKEQWFIALCSACKTDGGTGAAVSALYSSFCDYTRASASVEYPQVC